MSVVGEATVIVKGDASKFGPETERQVAAGLDPVAKRIASVLGGAFVGAKVFAGFKQGLDELKDSAAVAAQTGAAIKSTGGAANVTSDQIGNLADSLSKMSGTDDELIQKGANLLLTFKNVQNQVGDGNAIFDEATKAALDLSTAGFGSMESASVLLGKALNDPVKGVTALQRVGVALTAGQKETVKQLVATGNTLGAQKIILQEVESQVGGSAKAFGETLPGQIAKAKVASDNMKGALVGGLAPALEFGATLVTGLTEKIGELPAPAQTAIGSVLGIGAVFFTVARPINEGIKLLEGLGVIHRTVAVTADAAAAAEAGLATVQTGTVGAATAAAGAESLLAVAEGEVAVSAAAAEVGVGSLLATIGGVVAVAAPVVAVLGILGKSWLDQQGDNAAAEQTVKDYMEALKATTGAVQDHVDAVTAQKLVDAGVTGLLDKAGVSARSFADEVRNGGRAAIEFSNGVHQLEPTTAATAGFIERTTHAVDPFSKSLIEAYKAGQITWPEVRKLADQARSLGIEFGTATDKSKQQADAEGVVKDITGKTTVSIEDQEKALAAASKAADAFGGFISDLASAMGKSYAASVSNLEITSKYEGAADNLVDTLRKGSDVLYENAQTLDLTSKKGRENTAALLDTGDAIAALIEKRFQETHSIKDAVGVGEMYVQNLRDQLTAAGFTEEQVQSYIDTMNLTPEDIATTFSNNAVEQQIVVGKYLAMLDDIDPAKRTEIEVLINQGAYDEANRLLNQLADPRAVDYYPEFAPAPRTGGGPRAAGGPVTAGEGYLVGERGMEWFQPSSSGNIIPNDALGSMLAAAGGSSRPVRGDVVSISVDARGARDPWAVAQAVSSEYGERKWRFPRR